jgi:hypothetical protein
VRLKVTSASRTPEKITDATGILCDHSWRIGEKRGKTILVEKTNGWVLNSKMPKNATLEAHIEELLGRLFVHADRNQNTLIVVQIAVGDFNCWLRSSLDSSVM